MYQTMYGSRSPAPAPLPLKPNVLILGGGVVGITVARELAREGIHIDLVENDESLGGSIRDLYFFYDRRTDVQKWIGDRIAAVEGAENIIIHKRAKLKRFDGHLGSFQALIDTPDGQKVLPSSIAVLATGCITRPPAATNSGDGVIGLSDMEKLLAENRNGSLVWRGRQVKTITYLLDQVNDDIKIDAVTAVKQSLILQEMGCRVSVIVRDLKVSASGMERLYRQAREGGVLFFKYDEPPVLSATGDRISVDVQDTTALRKEDRETVSLPSDLVVTGEAYVPDPSAEELCRIMKLRLGARGLFMDDNPQFQRVLSNRRGIFLAGACRFPQIVTESLSEAYAVVQEVKALLHPGSYTPVNPVAEVDSGKCAVCYTCVRLCPHAAIAVETHAERNVYAAPAGENEGTLWGAARIEPAACFGCGICAAECPARAITLYQ